MTSLDLANHVPVVAYDSDHYRTESLGKDLDKGLEESYINELKRIHFTSKLSDLANAEVYLSILNPLNPKEIKATEACLKLISPFIRKNNFVILETKDLSEQFLENSWIEHMKTIAGLHISHTCILQRVDTSSKIVVLGKDRKACQEIIKLYGKLT
ncbi:hypothetical protein AAG747_26780 [Rapidithrix thailandica]|uniref:Uncharacterized protein n=1 Tax=Rapidithrix thailandica TaxID=413964 RepID=A0AAW9SG31_9BACT